MPERSFILKKPDSSFLFSNLTYSKTAINRLLSDPKKKELMNKLEIYELVPVSLTEVEEVVKNRKVV